MSTLLTIREVAGRAAVSFSTARRWIDSGTLPFIRIGYVVRIRLEDLDSLLESSMINTGKVAS